MDNCTNYKDFWAGGRAGGITRLFGSISWVDDIN